MANRPDTPDDDDALHWDGDEADRPARPVLPAGWRARGKGSDTVHTQDTREANAASMAETTDVVDAGEPTGSPTGTADGDATAPGAVPLGNAALVGLGILGGIYALYTIGWAVGGFRLQTRALWLTHDAMYQASLWLGILAPLIWFAATWLLTRGRATWLRIVWLVAGAVLLVPWPFLMTGMVGA